MSCISRITNEASIQYFGNGRNKFYVEFRCNQPCVNGSDICNRCSEQYDTCKNQFCLKFPHGKVNGPIPDRSHIFGGKWYQEGIKKYGLPTEEVIQFALEHQQKARNILDSEVQGLTESSVEKKPSKIKIVSSKKKKDDSVEKTKENSPVIKINPYSSLVQKNTNLVHKEVSLPTHIEKTMEEIDIDDYMVEYVTLKPFELHGSTYFRDYKKNKLYKNIKNKLGDYVGRYHPSDETIHDDIPDSDEE